MESASNIHLNWGVFLNLYYVIAGIFIVIDSLLLIGFLYAFRKARAFKPHLGVPRRPKRPPRTLGDAIVKERWQAIMKRFAKQTPESLRIAVIEADALVDDFLKRMGYAGEHLADRLSTLDVSELKSLNNIWRAHRLRNDLVHAPGATLSADEAKKTLGDYAAFLREIGALPPSSSPPKPTGA